MTEPTLHLLRHVLVSGYEQLKAQLTRRLGSADLAADAVQDTWVRLQRLQTVGAVSNPSNYLFRVALNVARDRLKEERRYTGLGANEGLDMIDEAAGPAQTIEARSDLMRIEQVLAELPARQRDILIAARLDGLARSEIAMRLGVSLSTVEKELKLAHEYCVMRMLVEDKDSSRPAERRQPRTRMGDR